MISKDGMRMFLDEQADRRKEAKAEGKELRLRKADLDYQGLDKMSATILSAKGEKIVFIFEREGFANWKMKAVELNLDNIAP